jgi:hypothetical protein
MSREDYKGHNETRIRRTVRIIIMTETVETVAKPSNKRQIASIVATVGVTVAVGVLSNVLIAKISDRILNPKTDTEDSTDN